MAFNVSSISKFTNETRQELVKKAVLTGKTMNLVTILPGVKYKETLNLLENTITVADASCGFKSAGSVAFSQRVVEVAPLEVKDSLCEKTLEQYYLGQMMKPGSPKDEELGPILGDSYVEKIKEYNEKAVWLGNTGSTGANGKVQGFIAILDAAGTGAGGYVEAGDAGATAGTIVASVDAMVAAVPDAISGRDDLTLFMSYANYKVYCLALRTANFYHYDANMGPDFEIYVPGTNVKVVATHGLQGSNRMVLTYAENLVIGTDLLNEEEKFDIWYSMDNDEVRVNIQWKLGCQVYFPEFVVMNPSA